MIKLQYTFKTDTLFKMLFVKNPELLKHFIAVLLGITVESIETFEILNPEMPPNAIGEKFCRLDIHMTVNGQRVDLEIQVEDEGDYPERAIYYWARDFSSALLAGQRYSDLPRTIIVSILNFSLFDCGEYHSHFEILETERHSRLSDKMGLHFYELPKLPAEFSEKNMLLLWLSLFKADTKEELEKIQALEVPVMNQAINAYYTITASSEFREMERLREKAGHDEAQALYHAQQKGEEKGRREKAFDVARGMKEMGLPLDQIARLTELSYTEVEAL